MRYTVRVDDLEYRLFRARIHPVESRYSQGSIWLLFPGTLKILTLAGRPTVVGLPPRTLYRHTEN